MLNRRSRWYSTGSIGPGSARWRCDPEGHRVPIAYLGVILSRVVRPLGSRRLVFWLRIAAITMVLTLKVWSGRYLIMVANIGILDIALCGGALEISWERNRAVNANHPTRIIGPHSHNVGLNRAVMPHWGQYYRVRASQKGHYASMPLWMLASSLLVVPLINGLFVRDVQRTGECVRCGYDLTGNVSGKCPECGTIAGRAGPAERVQNVDPSPGRSHGVGSRGTNRDR